MKTLNYLIILAGVTLLVSCNKEEAIVDTTSSATPASPLLYPIDLDIPSDRLLDLRAISNSGPRFQFKKLLDVNLMQTITLEYNLSKYAGTCVIAPNVVLEFNVQEQFNHLGAFIFGRSQFKLNGKIYESVDYPDEAGKGVISFLSLRLADGRLIPQQGYIRRSIVFLYLRANDLGEGMNPKLTPVFTHPQTESHLGITKQSARIELSGTILRLPTR